MNSNLAAQGLQQLDRHFVEQEAWAKLPLPRGALESVGFSHLMQTDGEFRPFLESESLRRVRCNQTKTGESIRRLYQCGSLENFHNRYHVGKISIT